ncbi:MAG: hypothetical protein IPF73_12080, partial [Betaproteobacteria bacterium]|nr:hypothetical protein [Betaproteobacteria bacterium]
MSRVGKGDLGANA